MGAGKSSSVKATTGVKAMNKAGHDHSRMDAKNTTTEQGDIEGGRKLE